MDWVYPVLLFMTHPLFLFLPETENIPPPLEIKTLDFRRWEVNIKGFILNVSTAPASKMVYSIF